MITIVTQPNKVIENAFNNQVYTFTADPLKVPVRAEWIVIRGTDTSRSGEVAANLGLFYVNLKSAVKSLLNIDNFTDNILPNAINFTIQDFNLHASLQHKFTVFYNDGTIDELEFSKQYTKAVEALLDPIQAENTNFRPLLTSNYVDFWQGNPFDIAFYSNEIRTVTITNETTSASTDVVFQQGVTRLFISDGSSFGFEEQLPLIEGVINVLVFRDVLNNTLTTLRIYKNTFCNAPYLKFFNRAGGWSYVQVNEIFSENTSAANRAFIENDTENVEDTISNFRSTGKTASISQRYETNILTEDQVDAFVEIYTSPKVFFYNGVRNQNFELRNWKEVTVNASSIVTKNTKLTNRYYPIEITMPNVYTQTYD